MINLICLTINVANIHYLYYTYNTLTLINTKEIHCSTSVKSGVKVKYY